MTKAQKVLKYCLLLSIALAALAAVSCNDKASTILKAEYISNIQGEYHLELISDSTFVTTFYLVDAIPNIQTGKFRLINDSIFFKDTIRPFKTTTARIKNSMVEFPSTDFRLGIIKSQLPTNNTFDPHKFPDYYLYTFNPNIHKFFNRNHTHYDLTANDLHYIQSILEKCISNNIITPGRKYNKQCIAVINEEGQKEVWVNCVCKEDDMAELNSRIIKMDNCNDCGDCYLNLKINLTNGKCYNVYVNGL